MHCRLVGFFIICLWAFAYVSSLPLKQRFNPLASLSSVIMAKHFSSFSCIAIIVDNNEAGSWFSQSILLPTNSSQLIVSIDPGGGKGSCYASRLNDLLGAAFQQSCTGFVVQLSEPGCFLDAWKAASRRSLYRHSPRILLLPPSSHDRVSPLVWNSPHLTFILDLIMVDVVKSAAYESDVTVQFVTSDVRSHVRVLAECKIIECSSHLHTLYPDKLSDLKNTELAVATFSYEPYVILGEGPPEGTEVRIALEYCRRHNCTLRFVTDGAEWGQIREQNGTDGNGTGDGILGNVQEERASVGLGALYQWYHVYRFLDFSAPYVRTGVTCLAPRPRPISTLLLPVRPFATATWAGLAASLGLAAVAMIAFRRLDDAAASRGHRLRGVDGVAESVLRTVGLAVTQPIGARRAEPPSTRTLLLWLHATFLLVATGYGSGLASILTVPSYERPVDTADDLVASGLSWGATHDAWVFSLREAVDPTEAVLAKRFRALPKETLHRHSLTDDFAFSIERLPAGHFAVGPYITEESMDHLRLMKQDIYFEHCIMVFPKGSPHLRSFNRLIHHLMSSGLLLFWEGEVSRRFLRSGVQAAIRESSLMTTSHSHQRRPTTALRTRHLQGAFILLAGGLTAAALAAAAEIYLGHKIKLKVRPKLKTRKRVTFKEDN